jgi:hypothetical protein
MYSKYVHTECFMYVFNIQSYTPESLTLSSVKILGDEKLEADMKIPA